MTLSQLEGLGDDFLSGVNDENAEIAEDLFNRIKTLPDDEKKYLKLYINTKITLEQSGCASIFKKIDSSLSKIFIELKKINKKVFGK
ncbi:MAG: hypothetical protein M1365_17115 [Actinobacteria bacterium]|nr:hypothetical protein [Actinomycetota bacterium]